VVGGGVGLAPLRSLLLTLFDDPESCRKIAITYGARNPAELLYRQSFDRWRGLDRVSLAVTVDNADPAWHGKVGLVTSLLQEQDVNVPDSFAICCGPSIMLKFVTFELLKKGYEPRQIYLSMNRRMSCGTGRCGRCNVGPYYLCKDGPDMNYGLIKDCSNVFA